MKTLRELANSVGYTDAPISMRGIAQILNLSPASLGALFYPDASKDIHGGDLHIGDVTISDIKLTISNDGNWQFYVHVHSDATWIGDKYNVGFAFVGDGHGAVLKEHIGHGDDEVKIIDGNDPWIKEHWHQVARLGVGFHAHGAGDETNWDKIFDAFMKGLEIATEIATFIPLLLGGGKPEPEPEPNKK